MEINNSNVALLVIDMQNDFITGSLAVAGSEGLIEKINKILDKFPLIVYSQDSHPEDHISFKGSISSITGIAHDEISEKTRGIFPVHCVKGTHGWELHKNLIIQNSDHIFLKGESSLKEEFSVFENPKLHEFLQSKGIVKVYICGLAYDYCVGSAALDARKLGYETYVIRDLTKSIDDIGAEEMSAKLRNSNCGQVSYLDL